jgi:hypothetical protein
MKCKVDACLISKRVAATFRDWLAVSAEYEIYQCHIECNLYGRVFSGRPSIDFTVLVVTPLPETLFVMVAFPHRHSTTLPLVTEMLV